MSDTNARTPGVPIKPPDAAYRLEAWLGRVDDPRLELAGPGEYNELLQAAAQHWGALEWCIRGPPKGTIDANEVQQRLQALSRDRYFLTLTEGNIETLLALLRRSTSTGAASNAVTFAARILAAWVRRVSKQAAPTWASKQVLAALDAVCGALNSTAPEGAAGGLVYLLGTAAAAPQCTPADHARGQEAVTRALQQRRPSLIEPAQFPDALVGAAYLITGGPGVHGAHLTALLTSLLHIWTPPGSDSPGSPPTRSPSLSSANEQPGSSTTGRYPLEPQQSEAPGASLSQALSLSRLLEYCGALLRARAFSQDFGTRSLALADAKAIQSALGDLSVSVVALAGFNRGLGGRRGSGFQGVAEDWARLVEQQEASILSAAAAVLSRPEAAAKPRAVGTSFMPSEVAHQVQYVALACARCEAIPGSPLGGNVSLLVCLCRALFGDALSLGRLHAAAAPFALSERNRAGTGADSGGGVSRGVRDELSCAAAEVRGRTEGDAFKHVGMLARAVVDHCKAADGAARRTVLGEVSSFARHLEGGHRLLALGLESLGASEKEATEAAVRRVLDATFLTVTVCCEAILGDPSVPPGSVPSVRPAEPEAGAEMSCEILLALSCVEFCRVPYAGYGQLVTRAVTIVSGSRDGAEGLAASMPSYEDTIDLSPLQTEGFPGKRDSGARGLEHGHSTGNLGERHDLRTDSHPIGQKRSERSDERGETVENTASTSGREAANPRPPSLAPTEDPSSFGGSPVLWARDSVRGPRVHFMLRVLGPCVEKIGDERFSEAVLPTLLLFLLHPSAPVSRSAHALFVAFLDSREAFCREFQPERKSEMERNGGTELASQDLDAAWQAPLPAKPGVLQRLALVTPQNASTNEGPRKVSIPERAALFYVERSLAGFPGLTSFEAFTAGVAAIVRHVPPGSPAIVLALRRIAAAAKVLFALGVPYVAAEGEANGGERKSKTEGSAGGQLTRLLVHLIPIVDIQVLTGLLNETEAVVLSVLDQSAQQAALAELYEVLAANEDYTRKAHCTVWYQQLAAKCVKQFRARVKQGGTGAAKVKSKNGEGGRSWPRTWGLSRGKGGQIPPTDTEAVLT